MRTVKKIEVRVRKDESIQCISCCGTVVNGICNTCGGYTKELFYEHESKDSFSEYKKALEKRLKRNNYDIKLEAFDKTVEAMFERQIDISEAYKLISYRIDMAIKRDKMRKNIEYDLRYSASAEIDAIGRTHDSIIEAYNEYKESKMF